MTSNMLFTFNSISPVFLTILIGYFVKHHGVISEKGAKEINNLVFKLLLPVLLFKNIALSNIQEIFDLSFVLFISIATILTFFVSWIVGERIIKKGGSIGTFVQGSFRGNYSLLGIALIANVLGSDSAARAGIVAPFLMPLYNILSVFILTIRGKESSCINGKTLLLSLKNIVKNPIIIAVFVAIPFSYFSIPLPKVIHTTIISIGSCASAIALISVGANFNLKGVKDSLNITLVACFIKLFISPLLFMYIAYVMGFYSNDIVIIGLILGTPTAVSSYIMVSNMDGDETLAANILVLSTLLSVFTLSIIVYLSKSLNLIG